MSKTYTPTLDPLPEARVRKICADLIKDAKKDREYLLEAHKFFVDLLATDANDSVAKVQLGVILKLMQSSHTKTAEALRCLYRYEELRSKTGATIPVEGEDISEKDLFAFLKKQTPNE